MPEGPLLHKTVLITGAARRIGRRFALACARAGADVVIHHAHSDSDAESLRAEISGLDRQAWVFQADLTDSSQAASLIPLINRISPIHFLINNAAIFEPLTVQQTSRADWQRHMEINLTAPFLLSQAFAAHLPSDTEGRIVNILDWRALRPAADHFPYTISKAGLAALTRSMAVALAPHITVNGLALGAILPPSTGGDINGILDPVPAGRWAELDEVCQALLFVLSGPSYITGEILHIDGGRHLV